VAAAVLACHPSARSSLIPRHRFVHYNDLPQMLGFLAIGIGIGAGLMMGARRPTGSARRQPHDEADADAITRPARRRVPRSFKGQSLEPHGSRL
jgi:hypothetical protein